MMRDRAWRRRKRAQSLEVVFRISGSFSSCASSEWQVAQSCEIVLPSAVVCCSSWQRKQPTSPLMSAGGRGGSRYVPHLTFIAGNTFQAQMSPSALPAAATASAFSVATCG